MLTLKIISLCQEIDNIFFVVSMIELFIILFIVFFYHKKISKKTKDYNFIQQQYIGKIDSIRKDYFNASNKANTEILKLEEERDKVWAESEKEVLHVLSGVLNLIDLNENIINNELIKIQNKLDQIIINQNKL